MKAAVLFLWAGLAVAAPPPDLAKAFARIDARTETGVNFRDLSQLVGDANLELKMYMATPEASKHPAGVDLLKTSVARYTESTSLWNLKVGGSRSISGQLAAGYVQIYPKTAQQIRAGGAMIGNDMMIDYLLPFLWQDAADLARKGLSAL